MEGDQNIGVHKVSDGAAGVDLDGAPKVAFGGGPVVVRSREILARLTWGSAREGSSREL